MKPVPTQAHIGDSFWWSNRGDNVDTWLTRELDLSAVTGATLRFWTWFDIEKAWDYAYVTISKDGGKTWDVLQGIHASTENPLGNSYGPGYTGGSGSGSGKEPAMGPGDYRPVALRRKQGLAPL